MKTKLIAAAICIMAISSSCHNKEKNSSRVDNLSIMELKSPQQTGNVNALKEQKIPVGTLQLAATDSTVSPVANTPAKPAANPDWDKKIIKTATLKFEVNNFKNYSSTVQNTVKQFGGYVAQEEQYLTDEKSESVITIKVPVDQFEAMMNQLPGTDVKVVEKKITTEDVTGEVVDTKSRLEAKKQMRLKYLEFLKQSKNMEEVLQVQNEINGIQEEIESAAGRIDYLSHQASYSTINLTYYQPLAGYKPTDESPTFFTRIAHSFKTGASWFADLFVGLMTLWPLFLIAIGAYLGLKKIKKNVKPVINS